MATFAEADDVEDLLQRDLTAEEQTAAPLLLDMATGVIQDFTRQAIFAGDTVDLTVRTLSAGRVALLPEAPATDVTIEVDGEAFGIDRFIVDEGSAIVTRTDSGCWPDRIDVTYSHGYDDVPASIRAVCLQLVIRWLVNPEQVMQKRRGDYSASFASTEQATLLNERERLVLSRYRIRVP